MSYPKLTPIIAKGATEPRYLEDRFADAINVKDFGAKGDGITDDRNAFYEALKVFFNNPTKYKVLDLNGYNIGIGSNIVIRFGEGDFLTYQSRLGDIARGLTICNGMITWLGDDDTDAASYMIDIGTNSNNQAELVDFKFLNVSFNGHQKEKNLVKVFNFYALYFSHCVFSNFNDGTAVFLPSTTDDDVYCDDNGATFWDCRWYDLPASTMNGTPILSYCGDLIVSSGFAEWCAPFDFHIGSILFDGFHWSYGDANYAALHRCAIFRDPREIQIIGCDIDQGTFLFTTEGYFGGTTQVAQKNWSQLIIKNNKFIESSTASSGEGIINLKVSNADTNFFGFTISGNVASGPTGTDNAVDFLKIIDDGGSISAIRSVYQYVDAWGMNPGDTDFGTSAFSVANSYVTYIDETQLDSKYIGNTSSVIRGSKTVYSYGAEIGTDSASGIMFRTSTDDRWSILSNGAMRPEDDNTYSLGGPYKRIKEIYSASGTINTSDSREKIGVAEPSESLTAAWGKVGFKVFQFASSVEEKGSDKARLHVGLVAQDVKDALESEGLDASRYGLFCYDEWQDEYKDVLVVDKEAVFDSLGREIKPAQTHTERRLVIPAGSRYGIRYEEALALECAYQRWRLEQLEERINQLTNPNK